MKRDTKYLVAIGFLVLVTIVVSACSQNTEGPEEDSVHSRPSDSTSKNSSLLISSDFDSSQLNQHENIRMRTSTPVYPKGVSEVQLIIDNQSNEEVYYGKEFSVEQSFNGNWYKIPFEEEMAFIAIAIQLAPGGVNEETVDLTLLEKQLAAGTYRIIKTIGGAPFSAEFTVE